ncbi:D-tagatose-bisphosphate aldolase, class II, non-catalytic subunit [Rhizobium sp. NPDC090279]|uniref:D-tagatose-bisphosphate aldolase, class II, non-catalytic subunit n=1 Tax=Rhizobium sp. NPDC090279 TaxID=3364499 RepID=UPI00383A1112
MSDFLRGLAEARRAGRPVGITSVCSAHPLVLEATLSLAQREGGPVLIEATCNQVNQFGGYTGKTPAEFAGDVLALADASGVAASSVILGGDHLGPNPWRREPASEAMAKADVMVAAYVKAGFTKIHLDASMACADDPSTLDDMIVAQRAARLAKVAEQAARDVGTKPVYVLGTEVPVPGGADHALDVVEPTGAEAAKATIATHREIFIKAGLSEAFDRCIAFVVQPGVEFGNENVVGYRPQLASELTGVLDHEAGLVFEAHSTDYQSERALTELVRDGFPILKVGPGLTFALREGLFALDLIATELDPDYARNLAVTMERLMLQHPGDWAGHYHGSDEDIRLQLRYSYSDRIRYYWGYPEAVRAVQRLTDTLHGRQIPQTLASQFLGRIADRVGSADSVSKIARMFVGDVLETYGRACRQAG